jgi:hypothetical protein
MPARDLGFPLTLCALFSEDRLIDSILSSPSRREMRRLRSPEARLSQINEQCEINERCRKQERTVSRLRANFFQRSMRKREEIREGVECLRLSRSGS